jgi:hypothetical protein
MIYFRLELIGVKYLDGTFLKSGTYRFPITEIDFDMDHIMWKWFKFWVVVGCTVEDEITGLEILLLEVLIGEEVELVGLVPFVHGVAELLTEVEDYLAD